MTRLGWSRIDLTEERGPVGWHCPLSRGRETRQSASGGNRKGTLSDSAYEASGSRAHRTLARAPDLSGLIRGFADEIRFPDETRRVDLHNVQSQGAPVGFVEVSAVAAMLAHLQLLNAVDALIDKATDDDTALSPEQRKRATAETAANILQAERHESALVWKALDQSLAVSHRSNIDPLAVMGLGIVPASSRPPVEPSGPMVIQRVGV